MAALSSLSESSPLALDLCQNDASIKVIFLMIPFLVRMLWCLPPNQLI